jgi:omega-6 fatty acid desaturase (delta-12 desaturase)
VDSTLRAKVAAWRRPSAARAWLELLATATALGLGLALMFAVQTHSLLLSLLLALPVGLTMLRLFVIQHDCSHRAFFVRTSVNDLVGTLLGLVTLAPHAYWRRTHAHHHKVHGNLEREQLGGLETLTVARYLALSPARKLVYRLYRHPLVLIGLGPLYQFGLKHRLPLDVPWSWRREWASVLLGDLALLLGIVVAQRTVGLERAALVLLPVWQVMVGVGIWLFYVQHQFERAYWRPAGEWRFVDAALRGSTHYVLPAWLDAWTGWIGHHHIHHLVPRIPMYRLRGCGAALPELAVAPRLRVRESLACARLRLWDESRERLIGLAELRGG